MQSHAVNWSDPRRRRWPGHDPDLDGRDVPFSARDRPVVSIV
jgi:hypothetical protein